MTCPAAVTPHARDALAWASAAPPLHISANKPIHSQLRFILTPNLVMGFKETSH
jgi:hypothetical protein